MADGDFDAVGRFAGFVATLGRGPGRSRALTRGEAHEAFLMALRGEAEPLQVGAFLMLLRYRGEDPEEVTGLVEAARLQAGLGREVLAPYGSKAVPAGVDLDWPSYGAGRTRGAPWFLLSALALARSGVRVLMHGSNEFSSGVPVAAALAALGVPVSRSRPDVAGSLEATGFAYWPAECMAPDLARLLNLRRLLGLRSPVNTVARLLDPADAAASVDGVFHPPYIDLHLGVAERLARRSLLVLKGGGGEAERAPGKATLVRHWQAGHGVREILLPPRLSAAPASSAVGDQAPMQQFLSVWRGGPEVAQVGEATVIGTIAMALLALEPRLGASDAEERAQAIWRRR